jgi:hypothetical protein
MIAIPSEHNVRVVNHNISILLAYTRSKCRSINSAHSRSYRNSAKSYDKGGNKIDSLSLIHFPLIYILGHPVDMEFERFRSGVQA